ncbi:unnamed protein product, partial [Effrenium voratum]
MEQMVRPSQISFKVMAKQMARPSQISTAPQADRLGRSCEKGASTSLSRERLLADACSGLGFEAGALGPMALHQGRESAAEALLLREWLRDLEVTIPNLEISSVRWLGFEVNITGGTCNGLELEDISAVSANDPQLFRTSLRTDLGLRCVVNTSVQVPGPSARCEVELQSAASVMQLQLQVPIEDGLPGQVAATCELTPDLTLLHFRTRSLACETLRLAETAIRAFINDLAARLVCNKVSSWIGTSLSQASAALRSKAAPFLEPAKALPVPAVKALDLQEVFWKGPMGRVLRSFMKEVIHTGNAAQMDQVLGLLLRDLGFSDGKVSLPTDRLSHKGSLPWIQDLLLSLQTQSASLDVTQLEDLHFRFTDPSAASISGAWGPSLALQGLLAVELPTSSAVLHLAGHAVKFTQHQALSPLKLQLHAHLEVSGAAQGFVAYNSSGLRLLQLDQMQRASCASAYLVQNSSLQPLQLLEARCAPSVRKLQVALPDLDLGDLELRLLEAGQELLSKLYAAFGQPAAQLVDGFVSQRGRELVNDLLRQSLARPLDCPASNFSSGELGAIETPAAWTSAALLSVTLGLLLAGGPKSAASNLEDMRTPLPFPAKAIHGASPEAAGRRLSGGTGPGEASPRGLGWQPTVSPQLRWGMLCGIAGTTALFVYASVTPGVLFAGAFEASGMSSETKNMASLSMDNSLVQTLHVGSYYVFAAMLVFSVMWPYIKLLMMVYIWAAPVERKTRGVALLFLDQVGKWSLMDNIILFLFIVFFWIAWQGEDVAGQGHAFFGLRCSPGIELNTFLAATILSLLLGHGMLWVHRQTGKLDEGAPLRSDSLRWLGLAHVGCILLTVLSWQVDIVDVSFSGLVGTFLKVTEQPTSKTYSILGILSCLGKQGSTYLQ